MSVPDAVVTATAAVPAGRGGEVQVMDVCETTVTEVQAEPPTLTVAPSMKLVPVMVIGVPPSVDRIAGKAEVTVGGPT